MDVIDWGAAQRVGELIAGSPPFGGVSAASVQPLAHEFAARVGDYSGLQTDEPLPPLELVDRPSWIAANLRTMQPLLEPLGEHVGSGSSGLAGSLRSASGLLMGAQVGALAGMLSQRVLGQYELALLDASVRPRLLLLAPNLAQASRSLGVDREELVKWVSIHEITHAVQFAGAPWLRDHLGGLLKQLIDGLHATIAGNDGDDADGEGGWRGWMPSLSVPDAADLRQVVERARRGEFLRLTLGEERWELVEAMQSAMSLIEGHAEHTMDAVGAEFLPTLPRLRAALNRRREHRGLPWRVLERLLGLELKMRQYETGRRFCDAVVDMAGPHTLALAWRGPDALPTAAELASPAAWVKRVTPPHQ